MKEYQNANFSLLSQQEIDVLVKFLTDKQFIESDVLSQVSIDKLVALLNGDLGHSHQGLYDPSIRPIKDMMKNLGVRENEDDICELKLDIREDKSLHFFAVNVNTGKSMDISPKTFDEGETVEEWGHCMSPLTFNRMAHMLGLKYSAQTYSDICTLFAERNYGDREARLPALYIPTNEQNVMVLL